MPLAPPDPEAELVLSYDSVKRGLLVGVTTTGIVGIILLVGIAVGITVSLPTVAIVSIILGVFGVLLSLFDRVQYFYRIMFQDSSFNDEETNSQLFQILSSHRRRIVLTYLADRDKQIELSDLVDQVTAAENKTTVEDLTDKQRKRTQTALYQTHLPKMAEFSLLEYDLNKGFVELTDQGYDAVEHLKFFDEQFAHRLQINSEEELSHFFHVLRNVRRRYVLHYLNSRDQLIIDANEIVNQVAAWNYDCDISEVSSDQRRLVYTSLYATHLERLEDADLINWDPDHMTVEIEERSVVACEYLSLIEGTEDFPLVDVSWASS